MLSLGLNFGGITVGDYLNNKQGYLYIVIIGKVCGCPGRMSIFDGVVQLVYELNVHRALHVTIGKHVIYMIWPFK